VLAFARSRLLGKIPAGSSGHIVESIHLQRALGLALGVLGGAALAILLGRWDRRFNRLPVPQGLLAVFRPAQRTALALSRITAEPDARLQQWPVAGACLLVLLIVFGIVLAIQR
jgi:hypothetical protein